MSNLYKQYNTVEPERNVRVMDYNALVEQKLAALIKQQNHTEGVAENGFRALGEIAEETIEEDPIEVLQNAKSEAEEIISKAKSEAEEILAQARATSEEILAQAKEDGYNQGYETGELQAKETLESEYIRKEEELERFKLQLQENYNQEMHDLEPKLLDVILTVVEKVFHIQFGDKKEILLFLIGNAIANIKGCKTFRLRVNEEQKTFIEHHKEEIFERIGYEISLEIVSDVSLNADQCVIETDTGIFDCSLGVQLENLIKDLKSLSL